MYIFLFNFKSSTFYVPRYQVHDLKAIWATQIWLSFLFSYDQQTFA